MQSKIFMRYLLAFSLSIGLQLISAMSAHAATGTWSQTGAGPFSWPDSGNWSAGTVPNAAVDIATFPTLGGPATQSVTLDGAGPGPITLATLNLNSTATSYAISNGTGTGFTFAGATPAITVGASALPQTIDANLTNGGTGLLTITNGGAGLLTLNGTINNGGQPLFFNTTPNTTVTNVISGAGSLSKRGTSSILTLSGANTYGGGTYFGQAAQAGANIGTIALTGGNDRLLSTSVVNFHPLNYVSGGTYTTKLDIGSTSQTLSTIHLPGADPGLSQAPTGAAVTIAGSGGTLKLNGDNLNIGIATNATYTGALTHNVNMSTLTNFIFDNSAKQVAVQLMGASRSSAQVATLTMATNNTVTASNFLVGNTSPGGSVGGGSSTVNLGNGTNVLTIGSSAPSVLLTDNAINVGFGVRSTASMTMPSGGSVTIRGYNGGLSGGSNPLVALNIGHIFNSADNTAFTDSVNFSAGTVDALITNMLIGLAGDALANTARAGRTNASFTMGAGTVTVNNLTIGSMRLATGTTVGITGATVGTLRSNSSFIINHPNGVLNATTINIAENLDLGASLVDASDVALVTGGLGLTDGTVRATTIQQPHTVTSIATALASISWATGTIENTAGSNLTITDVPITLTAGAGARTFNATGTNSITQASTSPIGGLTFGVAKTGTGKLVYNATNTYTGLTTVSQGTLLQNGNHTGGGNYEVTGGTLGGTGTISGSVQLLGGTLAPGASIESLDIGGNLTMTSGTYSWEYSGGGGLLVDNAVVLGADLTNVSGALSIASAVSLVGANLGTASIANGVKFTVLAYGSGVPGTFASMPDDTVVVVGGKAWTINYNDATPGLNGGTGSSFVTLTAIPEASSIFVTSLGGAFALGAVWLGKRMGFRFVM